MGTHCAYSTIEAGPFCITIDAQRIGDVLEDLVQVVLKLRQELEHGEGGAEHADAEGRSCGPFLYLRQMFAISLRSSFNTFSL